MKMSDLAVNQQARVLAFAGGDTSYCQQLMAMGMLPNTVFTVLRVAPLGDPIEIDIRGMTLCLRKREANCFIIEAC
ncbi:MAG: hypothetical protein A3F43_02355 [Gammaproteobacteria bacterium RIFCSPHIGHO2_12_FULL_42_10]|nr:MAG: hypothetical protein A3F43_02355 [Gammaproteobacteria bacterium RIFCSPHIGHO2_12_FULL_42_10]